ncbi:cox cluster protein [Halorarum salinum]|uniref:Cox cluster protein n=2 Tax=Halorarum salinum TaxID=2743089 RepID=A0A7D5LD76_9EURY|nr:cox cluster protein [Halobaculum salinum]QLG63952.1 cox cluster protein [Halobaculum salinum]
MRRTGGRRLVLVLYALLVFVGGAAGVLVSVFVEGLSAPRLFGLIALPVSTVGFAAYGAVTVAVLLGVPLLLVAYVSADIDDAPDDG